MSRDDGDVQLSYDFRDAASEDLLTWYKDQVSHITRTMGDYDTARKAVSAAEKALETAKERLKARDRRLSTQKEALDALVAELTRRNINYLGG